MPATSGGTPSGKRRTNPRNAAPLLVAREMKKPVGIAIIIPMVIATRDGTTEFTTALKRDDHRIGAE
ncbi:unnamed protein product [Acidithrix sp. C25]|nr:unnamed protein product [Acidithrix sp. C25]